MQAASRQRVRAEQVGRGCSPVMGSSLQDAVLAAAAAAAAAAAPGCGVGMGQLCLRLPAPEPQTCSTATLSWAHGSGRWDSRRDPLRCPRSAAHVPWWDICIQQPSGASLGRLGPHPAPLQRCRRLAFLCLGRYLQHPGCAQWQAERGF